MSPSGPGRPPASRARCAQYLSFASAMLLAAPGIALAEPASSEAAPASAQPSAAQPQSAAEIKASVEARAVSNLGQGAARPWADGVSIERQRAAVVHFQEGNALLKEAFFAQAARKYRDALAEWDHPGIHYNLALALMNLDQPVEVHEQLTLALKYGVAPLDEQKFEYAKSYLTLVERQLAPVDIRCDEIGAVVSLDGRFLFRSPGRYKALLRPGSHTVKAAKAGFATTERTRVLLPGQATHYQLRLYTTDQLIEYRRPWPLWGPVAITGAGAAILTAGAIFSVSARNRFEDYDRQLENDPACRTGCVPRGELADTKREGDRFQTLATVSYVTGGTVLAGGVVLLILNRSVPYRVDPSEGDSALFVSPSFGGGQAGLVGAGRF